MERRIAAAIPSAKVRWHYRYVLDALAVVAPRGQVARLAALPGVARVYQSVEYHSLLDQSVPLIKAPVLWGPTLATAGQGIKIGIIDDGVDQAHAFFGPAGLPPEVTQKLSAEIHKAVTQTDLRERLQGLGTTPIGSSATELAAYQRSDIERWTKVVKAAGIKPEQ